MLLMARIVTGLFGGVIGSVVLAIATDLFPLEMRGRVMGFIQTAFAASQVLGLPAGLYFANRWDWHAPFLAIIAVAVPVGLVILLCMKPVAAHLALKQERSPFAHLAHTMAEPRYRLAFILTMLLPTGGYMLMPFGTAYIVNNIGLRFAVLPTIYLVTGLCTVFIGPLVGKASDSFGKFNTFCFGSMLDHDHGGDLDQSRARVAATVIVINVLLFIGIFSRMIPSQALMSAIPEVTKRGAFNAINASLQQFAGGISAAIAGAVIVQHAGRLAGAFQLAGLYRDGDPLMCADPDVFRAQVRSERPAQRPPRQPGRRGGLSECDPAALHAEPNTCPLVNVWRSLPTLEPSGC